MKHAKLEPHIRVSLERYQSIVNKLLRGLSGCAI